MDSQLMLTLATGLWWKCHALVEASKIVGASIENSKKRWCRGNWKV